MQSMENRAVGYRSCLYLVQFTACGRDAVVTFVIKLLSLCQIDTLSGRMAMKGD